MFGKLFTLIGIAMMGFGIFGVVRASQSFMGTNFGSTMELATDAKAREAQLCKPGETLEEDKGASSYTPGQGYGRSVTMYCVNSDHQKRDVTAEFATSMVGQVGGIFGSVFSGIMGTAIYFILIIVGLLITIIGLLVGRRRTTTVTFGVPVTTSTVYSTSNAAGFDLNQVSQQSRDTKTVPSGDLTARLKQLDDALKAGLITQSEYNSARERILDTLK